MDNPINSQDTLKDASAIIQSLDELIGLYYSTLQRTVNEQEIVEIQAYIDRMKKVRLGWFNLTQLYTMNVNNNQNGDQIYSCVKGDTLAIISQAFFGNIEYGDYLYYYNDLQTPLLEPNQKIKIPNINSGQPLVLFSNPINFIEQNLINQGIY